MTRDDSVDQIIGKALADLDDDQRAYLTAPPGIDPEHFAEFPSVTLKPHQVAIVRFILVMATKMPHLAAINMRVQPANQTFGTVGYHAWQIVKDINAQIEFSGKRPDDVGR